MNFIKKLLQSILKGFVFGALVEFAHEVAAGAEGVVAEGQGSIAEILPFGKERPFASAKVYAYRGVANERGEREKDGKMKRRKGMKRMEGEQKERLTILPA